MEKKYQLDSVSNLYPSLDSRIWSALHLKHIYTRVHKHKFNFLAMVTGKHRVGKSLTALSFAHVLDPTFADNLETRVVYYADEFMDAMKSLRRNNTIGGAIVWDEAGVGLPSREWYNISNKAVGMACQVFGYLRPIIFFVTQDVSYIDSQVRKLFHGFYEMNRLNSEYAIAKPFNVSYNKRNGKVYYRYSRFRSSDIEQSIGIKVLRRIHVKRPPKSVENHYDRHSKEFKDLIMKQMKQKTEAFEERADEGKKKGIKDIIEELSTEHRDDVEFLSKRSKPDDVILDKNAIRYNFDVSDSKARFIKKKAEIAIRNKMDAEIEDEENKGEER